MIHPCVMSMTAKCHNLIRGGQMIFLDNEQLCQQKLAVARQRLLLSQYRDCPSYQYRLTQSLLGTVIVVIRDCHQSLLEIGILVIRSCKSHHLELGITLVIIRDCNRRHQVLSKLSLGIAKHTETKSMKKSHNYEICHLWSCHFQLVLKGFLLICQAFQLLSSYQDSPCQNIQSYLSSSG